MGPKYFGFKIFLGSNKNAAPKILSPQKILGPKKLSLKKFVSRTFWSTKIMSPKKLGPKSSVKTGPVTAQILLIWTNGARAYGIYVARTNLAITVGIPSVPQKSLPF